MDRVQLLKGSYIVNPTISVVAIPQIERSFENYVQILSEEDVTPEISPGALSDVAKEFSLRSIVAIVSDSKDSDKACEPDVVIPLFALIAFVVNVFVPVNVFVADIGLLVPVFDT